MHSPSRRHLLTAAAGALAVPGSALAVQRSEEGGDGAALVFGSRAAAKAAAIPVTADALFCGGYARVGDRGEALYARAREEPEHKGKFRSADGAWWELAEAALNPFQFGAAGNGTADDSAAIQAMFDFVVAKRTAYPIQFLGAHYRVGTGLTLPTVPRAAVIDVDGGGAILSTEQPITILSRIPKNQQEAMRTFNGSHYDIHHLEFRGSGVPGQIGLHVAAAYANVVRSCQFTSLDYGSIGTFCLAGAWRDNLYAHCSVRAFVIQTGTGYDQGPVWPGAVETNSASNVNVIENCRVFGDPRQKSAFGIFGSDSARMNGCISEGHGAGIDVHFDYQGSPTVKQFHVDMFHCEAPDAKLHFKVRASGIVCIDRLIRSYPTPIYDAQGSLGCQVRFGDIAWLADLPEATGKGHNPNGRWFYHSEGNGFDAQREGIRPSSETTFTFEGLDIAGWRYLKEPERWEGGVLPTVLHIRALMPANTGLMEWSTLPIHFNSPIAFADDSTLSGMKTGNLTAATAMVPAQSSVTESFAVPGILVDKHRVTINPLSARSAPPPGIAWNGYVESDGRVALRLTNVTDRTIALEPGVLWTYCAPRPG